MNRPLSKRLRRALPGAAAYLVLIFFSVFVLVPVL